MSSMRTRYPPTRTGWPASSCTSRVPSSPIRTVPAFSLLTCTLRSIVLRCCACREQCRPRLLPSTYFVALRAQVCWSGVVDAVDLARRFGLGRALRLSDGPLARGLVWRLDTADGSWAVKMPFHLSGEDEAGGGDGVPGGGICRGS